MVRKKASLTLSINAIVILILAITILGLGLGFIRTMFASQDEKFSDINAQLKGDIIEDLENSGDKVTFNNAKFEVESGTPYEFYMGIRNTADGPRTFYLQWVCEDAMDEGGDCAAETTDNQWTWFDTYDYIELGTGESEAFLVKTQPQGVSNTYMGKLYIYVCPAGTTSVTLEEPGTYSANDAPAECDGLYETQDFYFNVI